jgi:hypothetical protein
VLIARAYIRHVEFSDLERKFRAAVQQLNPPTT